MTKLKHELWIHCVNQVPEGSRVKLRGIYQIVYQIVSAVMLWWSNYFRTGLSWCGKCRVCVMGWELLTKLCWIPAESQVLGWVGLDTEEEH